jgi:hypothetical protein
MDRKILIGISVAVVVAISFFIFSPSDMNESSEEFVKISETKLDSSEILKKVIDAERNYIVPDTYKIESSIYTETYQEIYDGKIRDTKNKVEMSGYMDRKNNRASVEITVSNTEDSEQEELTQTIILKDNVMYTIKDGKIIDETQALQEWFSQDELMDIIQYVGDAEEILESSEMKISGDSYYYVKIVPNEVALMKLGGGYYQGAPSNIAMKDLTYDYYLEVWINKKTEQIERASLYTSMDMTSPKVVRAKVEVKIIRTEINEKIPNSVFDLPD